MSQIQCQSVYTSAPSFSSMDYVGIEQDHNDSRYTDKHFGYHMIERAGIETNRTPESRNFMNLADVLFDKEWSRDDLVTLMSQLYNVFEEENDVARCSEIDQAIDYIDAYLFNEDEHDDDAQYGDCQTPIYDGDNDVRGNNILTTPPPLLRLTRSYAVHRPEDLTDIWNVST